MYHSGPPVLLLSVGLLRAESGSSTQGRDVFLPLGWGIFCFLTLKTTEGEEVRSRG